MYLRLVLPETALQLRLSLFRRNRMIAMAVLEFLRVLFAFALTFLVLPLLAEGYRLWRGEPMDRQPADWIPILLRAFVFASFAAETLGLVLGSIRLCLPGLIVTGCVLWSVRGFLVAHQVRSGLKEADAQTVWRPLIALLEPQQSSELRSQLASMRFQPVAPSATAAVLWALLALTLLGFARPAIQQVSFDHPESYLRVISLAGLTRGNLWQADGSVAFLAPLVSFSGLDAASVIQFTGPILSAIFAALITVCVWQVWRTTTAAAVTLGLFFCIALAYSHAQWELLPNAMAIVYWTAGAAIWPYSRRHSLMAAATGFMIAPGQWVALVICLLLVLAVQLSGWLRSQWRFTGSVLAAVQCLAMIGAVTVVWQRANPDPQLSQYESAARTCKKITRQFHRNEWLVVSPFQELAFTLRKRLAPGTQPIRL